MALLRLCPNCHRPAAPGAPRCPRCGGDFAGAAVDPRERTANGRHPAGRAARRAGNAWLLALAVILGVAIIPGLIDLSSLLVNAGPDRPALERSRRTETLF